MYEDHENLNYLAHHGILGMKWGKQNGPPYPLSDAKHDRVVKRAENKRIRQEKRADRRRKNILKDPKKIVKYQDEFSKDEIESALDKMSTVDKVKSRIPEKKHPLADKIKKVKLSNKKKKLAATPQKLQKNLHKLTPEETREAIQYLENTERLFDIKINRAKRPLKVTNTAGEYLKSISDIFGNWAKLKDNVVTYKGQGFTNKERRDKWMLDEFTKGNISPEYMNILSSNKKATSIDEIFKNPELLEQHIKKIEDKTGKTFS